LAVALAGVVDLEAAIRADLGAGAVRAYVGAGDSRALSPAALLPLGVPTLLAHGRGDEQVPIAQSEGYQRVAAEAGEQVDLLDGPHDHYAYLEPDTAAWVGVAERVVAAVT
jgi:fermentation-respiration switch protein FrsA (DUF1100 family)